MSLTVGVISVLNFKHIKIHQIKRNKQCFGIDLYEFFYAEFIMAWNAGNIFWVSPGSIILAKHLVAMLGLQNVTLGCEEKPGQERGGEGKEENEFTQIKYSQLRESRIYLF